MVYTDEAEILRYIQSPFNKTREGREMKMKIKVKMKIKKFNPHQ